MKAITLWQPWASLIAMGVKTIETRKHDRFAFLKGQRIAIHAGLTWDANAERLVFMALDGQLPAILGPTLDAQVARLFNPSKWPRGYVVCTAMVQAAGLLTDVQTRRACCPAGGLYGLVLVDVEPTWPLVPCCGHQGVWEWSPKSPSNDAGDRRKFKACCKNQ